MDGFSNSCQRVVVTGIGLVTSVGLDRETSWRRIRRGDSEIGMIHDVPCIPDGLMLAAQVPYNDPNGRLKAVALAQKAAAEAVDDAQLNCPLPNSDRFGCSISAHMCDSRLQVDPPNCEQGVEWWKQFLPNTAISEVANDWSCYGPRLCHSTACASSLISIIAGARSILDGRCDVCLAGGADALHPLFAAGFHQMRVLVPPEIGSTGCRPFAAERHGFIMGEGGAILVLESLDHALHRGATIYGEILGTAHGSEAYHLTGLDEQSEALRYLINRTLEKSGLVPKDIGYINAHGTGTEQNDIVEMNAIRHEWGIHARDLLVSSTKSTMGHMINAAGSVEVATTLLAMRDGFAPPTMNTRDVAPECPFNCLAGGGLANRFDYAMKLSLAFGGHLAAIAMKRWNHPVSGFAYPRLRRAG